MNIGPIMLGVSVLSYIKTLINYNFNIIMTNRVK